METETVECVVKGSLDIEVGDVVIKSTSAATETILFDGVEQQNSIKSLTLILEGHNLPILRIERVVLPKRN